VCVCVCERERECVCVCVCVCARVCMGSECSVRSHHHVAHLKMHAKSTRTSEKKAALVPSSVRACSQCRLSKGQLARQEKTRTHLAVLRKSCTVQKDQRVLVAHTVDVRRSDDKESGAKWRLSCLLDERCCGLLQEYDVTPCVTAHHACVQRTKREQKKESDEHRGAACFFHSANSLKCTLSFQTTKREKSMLTLNHKEVEEHAHSKPQKRREHAEPQRTSC
jgi:hypothetical protein